MRSYRITKKKQQVNNIRIKGNVETRINMTEKFLETIKVVDLKKKKS